MRNKKFINRNKSIKNKNKNNLIKHKNCTKREKTFLFRKYAKIKSNKKIISNTRIKFYFSYKIIFIFILLLFYLIIFKHNKKNEEINYPIKIGFYSNSLKYGGIERVTALLLNILSKYKYFILYSITNSGKRNGEYSIPNNTKRICLSEEKKSIYDVLKNEQIDILIYNFYDTKGMEKLNSLNKTKVIVYNHSSFLIWIYSNNYNFLSFLYPSYKKCKYVLSLIPVENNYLFKKWGINSILIDNPPTFNYDSVIQSDLSSKCIIMIGRIEDPLKRYELGIRAMPNIIKEIPDTEMKIISKRSKYYEKMIKSLNLEKSIKITGYEQYVEKYLKNASLHIFPSLNEGYPMVLSETKIFGIPTIICGLDYLSLAKGGTVIIYDDNPETIAKEAIKILKDDKYRKKLGKEARESMKKRTPKLIFQKWKKILLSVYKGDDKAFKEIDNENKMTEEEANQILNNQLLLLKKRMPRFSAFSLEKLKSFSF